MSAAKNKLNEVNTLDAGVHGQYKNWFLDYASYVILERAVPAIEDGLKPVQRRLMHALREMDDGRFNKVANVIGQTMQYHPPGDASIGDAMVNMDERRKAIFVAFHDLIPGTTYVKPGEPWSDELRRAFDRTMEEIRVIIDEAGPTVATYISLPRSPQPM